MMTKTSSETQGLINNDEKVVEIRNLKKSFGDVKVLRD